MNARGSQTLYTVHPRDYCHTQDNKVGTRLGLGLALSYVKLCLVTLYVYVFCRRSLLLLKLSHCKISVPYARITWLLVLSGYLVKLGLK